MTGVATLSTTDPAVVRASILRHVSARADGDAGLFYGVAGTAEEPRLDSVSAHGDGALALYDGLARHPSLLQYLSKHFVSRGTQGDENLFLGEDTIITSRALYESTPTYQDVLYPHHFDHHLRTLIFHGPTFLGWLGMFRRADRAAFERRDAVRLNRHARTLRDAAIAADSLYAGSDRHQGQLVLRPDGAVDHATAEGARWLGVVGFRDALLARIRELDAGHRMWTTLPARADASIVRLDLAGGVRYLATVVPLSLLNRGSLPRLSPRQHQVAALAADGVKNAEIASELGVGIESVKTHLEVVFQKFGVRNRDELRRAWVRRSVPLSSRACFP